jgi:hypothetical protein
MSSDLNRREVSLPWGASFVLGAALPEERVTSVFEGFHDASLSMRSFVLRG